MTLLPLSCVSQESLDGTVEICFATPGEEPDPGDPGSGVGMIDQTVRGEVVLHREISDPQDWGLDCDAARAIRIADGQDRWTIGYRATDAKGDDVTPDVTAAVGTQVDVSFVRDNPWWIEHAFAVSQNDSLVLAMNDGAGATLPQPLPGGLTVETDGTYGDIKRTCGRVAAQKLEFCGESCETLNVGQTATIPTSAGDVGVRNVVAFDYKEIHCDDITDIDAWTAWRK